MVQVDGRCEKHVLNGGQPGGDRPTERDVCGRLEQIIRYYFIAIGFVRAEISAEEAVRS